MFIVWPWAMHKVERSLIIKEEESPGFGGVVTCLALMGAAMLSMRKRFGT